MCEEMVEDAMKFKNVHHSMQSICNVLMKDEFAGLAEVQELIKIFKDKISPAIESQHMSTVQKKPFIVMEGLDGSGKSTVTRRVAEKINAAIMSTPPKSILDLRQKFDKYPVNLRRAFYALGNYAAAVEVDDIRAQKPVVMDRFWHSTAAYGIAEELDGHGDLASLPSPGSDLYNWPIQLTKPDCVFLLTVSEESRNKRLGRRVNTITEEEKKLAHNSNFRAILLEAYKRMENPSLVVIDSNQEIGAVVDDVMHHLSEQHLYP